MFCSFRKMAFRNAWKSVLKKGLSWLAVKCSLSRVVLSCCICLRQNRGGRGKKKKNTSCLRIVISFKAACGGSACFVSLWPKEGGLAFFLSFLPSLLPARGRFPGGRRPGSVGPSRCAAVTLGVPTRLSTSSFAEATSSFLSKER